MRLAGQFAKTARTQRKKFFQQNDVVFGQVFHATLVDDTTSGSDAIRDRREIMATGTTQLCRQKFMT